MGYTPYYLDISVNGHSMEHLVPGQVCETIDQEVWVRGWHMRTAYGCVN